MNGKDLSRQFGDLPEEMIAEAMLPAKMYQRKHTAHRVLCLTAIAAAVVILFWAASLLPIGDDPVSPYFAVYVYANETDRVELGTAGNTFVFLMMPAMMTKKDTAIRCLIPVQVPFGTENQLLVLELFPTKVCPNKDP